ncbi:MAG: hexitol phosphatase HxpB [Cryomorphaceae bacterium]|nr:hexitol phosphatase HxpB [Flavobacteriales bacterium]
MIRAAIFDMDGLLVNSEPFWRKAEMECFAKVGITLSEDDCRETMGFRLNEVVALWYSRQPWQGASLADVEADIIETVSRYILEEAVPLPGVSEAIDICRKAGLKTAVASSSPMKLIESVVKRFDLESQFDCLHSAQHEEFGKPHPAVFIRTARTLGVKPEECVVFEDSFHGMVAGLAARMRVIAVPAAEDFDRPEFKAARLLLPDLRAFNPEILESVD